MRSTQNHGNGWGLQNQEHIQAAWPGEKMLTLLKGHDAGKEVVQAMLSFPRDDLGAEQLLGQAPLQTSNDKHKAYYENTPGDESFQKHSKIGNCALEIGVERSVVGLALVQEGLHKKAAASEMSLFARPVCNIILGLSKWFASGVASIGGAHPKCCLVVLLRAEPSRNFVWKLSRATILLRAHTCVHLLRISVQCVVP